MSRHGREGSSYTFFTVWTAAKPHAPVVRLVIGANVLWVLGSLIGLAMSPTPLGYVFVIA